MLSIGKFEDKVVTIGWKIILGIIGTVIAVLLLVGIFSYTKVKSVDKGRYADKLTDVMAVTDAALDTFFDQLESVANSFAAVDLVREDNDNLTSYVDKTDPSGKIPVDPDKYNEYEHAVYSLEKSFVETNSSVIGISVALESTGSFTRFPAEKRSNNYDSRSRSWYKNAKAKNGKVNFSDAYQASAGYRTIVVSRYFNDLNDNPRGVISIDADIDYIDTLLSVCRNRSEDEDELFILVDKNGMILEDQLDHSKEFTKIEERGIKCLEKFTFGQDIQSREKVDGKNYEFRSFKSNNKYLDLMYVYAIPTHMVDEADEAILHTILIAAVVGILLAIVISVALGKIISNPLKMTAEVLRNISEGEGDLTQRIPINGSDEISLVAKYFNKTFDKISNTVNTVVTESKVMTNVANTLSEDVSTTASAINQIASNISSIKNQVVNESAGVQETSATMKQISDNIDKLNKSVERQSSDVAQSSSAIEEMVANIRSVTDILEKNTKSVGDLLKSADNGRTVVEKAVELINKVSAGSEGLMDATSVIQNIASQTNLLAMNAAIEAAHAGDVGKGFAVVSDEIRKLAEDSSVQGKRISETLVALKDLIQSIADASSEIQNQFNEIFNNTQKVSQQETVIKSAMEEQSAGSQQVLNAMREISNITGEVKSGAKIMEQGGKEILVEMEKLSEITAEITGSMDEMNHGIAEINVAMQHINEKTSENDDSIKRVSSEINKFKV